MENQHLIIIFLSVLCLTLVLFILACGFIQYKLMSKNSTGLTPWPHQGVVDLGLAPNPRSCLTASASDGPSTQTVKKKTESLVIQTRQVETNVLLTQHAQPNTPQLPPSQPTVAVSVHSLLTTPPPEQIESQLSLSCIYKTRSPEGLHSDDPGSLHSMEHFKWLDNLSQSTPSETSDSNGTSSEEEEENTESSESTILVPIHPM